WFALVAEPQPAGCPVPEPVWRTVQRRWQEPGSHRPTDRRQSRRAHLDTPVEALCTLPDYVVYLLDSLVLPGRCAFSRRHSPGPPVGASVSQGAHAHYGETGLTSIRHFGP